MKVRSTLFSIFSTTLLAFGVWLVVFFNFSPLNADKLTFAAFYGSLFLWLTGIITFALFYTKVYLSNKEVVFSILAPSARQATLIAGGLVSLLFFQGIGVLSWWEAGLWISSLLLLEMYFRSEKG
ncbi:MAG: hypothetical protein WCW17_02415 [Patescibacteria group bacterium]|jgi:hypothetical protein